MIYNQGFEVTVAGYKYFAFLYYTQDNTTVTSYCGTTFPGACCAASVTAHRCRLGAHRGRHRLEVLPGCEGHRRAAPDRRCSRHARRHSVQAGPNVRFVPAVHQQQRELVHAVNDAKLSWTAQEYDEFEARCACCCHVRDAKQGVSVADLQRRAGAANSRNPFADRISAAPARRAPDNLGSIPVACAVLQDWLRRSRWQVRLEQRQRHRLCVAGAQPGQLRVVLCIWCAAHADMPTLRALPGFSATYESRLRILTNMSRQDIISPQDVVSCSEYSQGCDGGFPYLVGKYSEDFGLVQEACYPYIGQTTPCDPAIPNCPRLYGTDYHYIGGARPSLSGSQLTPRHTGFYGACTPLLMQAELLANGPIAISFEVYNDFLNYKARTARLPRRHHMRRAACTSMAAPSTRTSSTHGSSPTTVRPACATPQCSLRPAVVSIVG